jgi:hypothetical protein
MTAAHTDRPNVVVFFADQQRWDTTGVHGNPLDLTPNFDRMARHACGACIHAAAGVWSGACVYANRRVCDDVRLLPKRYSTALRSTNACAPVRRSGLQNGLHQQMASRQW